MKASRSKPQASPGKRGLASRLVATTLLTRVIDDQRNLDALCDLKHGVREFLSLDERDRSLARAIAVSALRHRTTIEFVLKKVLDRPPPKRARFLIHSLHVAVAQILFLDVPSNAAVDLAVTAIGGNQTSARFRNLSNAVLRRVAREKEAFLPGQLELPSPLPQWLSSSLRRDYGKSKLEKISDSLGLLPKVDITVKSDPSIWADKLGGKLLPTGSIRLETSVPVSELEGYADGEWWVQDAAASIPAYLVGGPKGGRVLEICAAPGGKTAQLINMGHTVTALDISAPRLKRMRENLARLKMSAEMIHADVLHFQPDRLFDAVLLDAPCSSTGTIRRHPDVMWTKTKEEVSELAELQYRMLNKALDFVQPGGTLVFSNCSILKEEGENIHAKMLGARTDIKASSIMPDEVFGLGELINGQGALRSLPFHLEVPGNKNLGGMDGFFASRFIKLG